MKASIVDLRYNMKAVLKALARNEKVEVMYRGVLKGIIEPVRHDLSKQVKNHPYFGARKESEFSVAREIEELRKGRYDDL